MTAYEEIIDQVRALLVTRCSIDDIKAIEDIICVTLGRYNIEPKCEDLVVYDSGDTDIIKRFFIAKAVAGRSKETIRTYKSVLDVFVRRCRKHIVEMTSDDIRLYLAQLKIENKSTAYLAVNHRVLSSLFTWCHSEEIIEKNPMLKIECTKIKSKPEYALTPEQMELVRHTAKNKRLKALVEFLYSTGCRVSEALALNREDIDFTKGEVQVLGKGGKYRIVYLTQRCIFTLMDYLDARTDASPALFGMDPEMSDFARGSLKRLHPNFNPDEYRIDKSQAEQIIRKLGRKCGVRLHPHLFRKTVATHALRNGMPLDQVSNMLGHSNISTTTIYAQTDKADIKRSHEKFV